MHDVRCNLAQRNECEPAVVELDMRHRYMFVTVHQPVIQQDVQIDFPGSPALVSRPPESCFDFLELQEKLDRAQRRCQLSSRIQEFRLVHLPPWIRFVHGGEPDHR